MVLHCTDVAIDASHRRARERPDVRARDGHGTGCRRARFRAGGDHVHLRAGYVEVGRERTRLPDGSEFPVILMRKRLAG
jgi:hypothetical protein